MSPAEQLVALSRWVDEGNAGKAPETLLWVRVAKPAEEAGEAVAALIGATNANPRKGRTHDLEDVQLELLDVALAALGAVEHIRGHDGRALEQLELHLARVAGRALGVKL